MLWFAPGETTRILGNFQSWVDKRVGSMVRTHPYAYPHHIKVVKHLYVFDIDVQAILNGSIASSMEIHIGLLLRRHHNSKYYHQKFG